MIVRTTAFALLFLLVPAAGLGAEHEFSVFAGAMQDSYTGDSSYAWQLEFRNWMSDWFGASLLYLNEGHVPYHHRDGGAAQAWIRVEVFEPRLVLSGGVGPYYFFDTTQPPSGIDYANEHGWGIIRSLALTWHAESRMIYQLRANDVETKSLDTRMVLIGLGYQLSVQPRQAGSAHSRPNGAVKKNEFTLLVGRTIVNSFQSEYDIAACFEYRRRLARFFEGTIGVLDEGKPERLHRSGAEAQLWLVREFLDDRASIGFGGGGYYAVDRALRSERGKNYFVLGMASLTASRLITADWKVRATWSRLHTYYHRDTDVILLGLGYIF